MSKEPNNIDRTVREKLDGFEMAPPPSVWSATEAAIVKPGGKRLFLWFFLGMTALAFIAVGAYYFSQGDSKKAHLADENTSKELTKTTTEKSTEKTKENAENNRLNNLERDFESLEGSDLFDPSNNDGNTGQRALNDYGRRLNSDAAGNSFVSNADNDFAKGERSNGVKNDAGSANTTASSRNRTASNTNLNNSIDEEAEMKNAATANTQSANDSGVNSTKGEGGNANANAKIGNQQGDNIIGFVKIYSLDSLPTVPVRFFETENIEPAASSMEEYRPPINNLLGKVFSIEGAIGISSFKNKAAKDTESELLTLLNNASTNRLSYDFRLGLNYHFTKQFSFQTGIEYNASREDYSITTETTTSTTTYDSVGVFYDSNAMVYIPIYDTVTNITTENQTTKNRNYYRLLTLPFQFAWNQQLSIRSELEFAIGGTISIYSRNNGSAIVDAGTAISSSTAYHTNGMLSLGGSIKYLHNLGPRHALYVEPWLQFGVTNQFVPQLNYESFRRRYGVRFGYRFYF